MLANCDGVLDLDYEITLTNPGGFFEQEFGADQQGVFHVPPPSLQQNSSFFTNRNSVLPVPSPCTKPGHYLSHHLLRRLLCSLEQEALRACKRAL